MLLGCNDIDLNRAGYVELDGGGAFGLQVGAGDGLGVRVHVAHVVRDAGRVEPDDGGSGLGCWCRVLSGSR